MYARPWLVLAFVLVSAMFTALAAYPVAAKPGDVLREQQSEGGCLTTTGHVIPCPLSYWPPGPTLPAGCDPSKPASLGNCTMTADLCTNLPGFIVAHDASGDYCIPERTPSHCPRGFTANPVMNDPHCQQYVIKPKTAYDPNDKTGTSGAGSAQFVAGGQPLSYTLHFENLAAATAPAQIVVVSDPLDPQKVDLDTLELGPIAFGNFAFVPPPGLQKYRSGIDLRPTRELIVTVDAALDKASGMLKWTFLSIDPATGELTADPDAGFLPPNTTPPAGEGSVTFTVVPRSGLATGTSIANQGSIVFDANAPIATPVWANVVDRTAPTSHVLSLPATQSSASFPVQWSGTDAGSGIHTFAVFVSDNGGPFGAWVDGTTGSSGMFSGQVGHSYGFFSIARDAVGNVEAIKVVADATTRVGSACALDVTGQVQITRSGFGYNLATGRFAQTVTLKNVSSTAIASPISYVLDNLSSNATLYTPAGTTSCATPAGSPFANLGGNLAAGASATLTLQFVDPTRTGITYVARVLAGPAGR